MAKKNQNSHYIPDTDKKSFSTIIDVILKTRELVVIVVSLFVAFLNLWMAYKFTPVYQAIGDVKYQLEIQAEEQDNFVRKDVFEPQMNQLLSNQKEMNQDIKELLKRR